MITKDFENKKTILTNQDNIQNDFIRKLGISPIKHPGRTIV